MQFQWRACDTWVMTVLAILHVTLHILIPLPGHTGIEATTAAGPGYATASTG